MALYQYRCVDDGPFEASSPMGTAPERYPCPSCSGEAPRMFTPPKLSRASSSAMTVIERSERSAHEPDVVTALPPRRRRHREAPFPTPSLQRLPRS